MEAYTVVKLGDHAEVEEHITIDNLNDDSLMCIFSFLAVEDLMKIEGVCTRWRDLSRATWAVSNNHHLDIRSFLSWTFTPETNSRIVQSLMERGGRFLKSLVIDYQDIVCEEDCLSLVAEHCYRLRELTLLNMSVSPVGMKKLSQSCKMIEDLCFDRLQGYSEDQVALLLGTCRNLIGLKFTRTSRITGRCLTSIVSEQFELLTIVHCQLFDFKHLGSAQQLFKTIKTLKIHYITQCTDDDLVPFLENSKNLVNLELIGLNKFTGKCLVSIVSEQFSTLVVESCEVFNPTYLKNVRYIKNLSLETEEENSSSYLDSISVLTDLTSLQMSFSDLRYTFNEDNLSQLAVISALKNLTILELNVDGIGVDDQFLHTISKNCRSLKELSLVLGEVTNSGWNYILDLPLLERLELIDWDEDDGRKVWHRGWCTTPSLKELFLFGYALTGEDIIPLVELSPSLEKIGIHMEVDEVIYIEDKILETLTRVIQARSNDTELQLEFILNGYFRQFYHYNKSFCSFMIK